MTLRRSPGDAQGRKLREKLSWLQVQWMTCWLQGSCGAKMTFRSCPKLAQGGQAFIVSHQSVVEYRLPLEWARPGVREISAAEAILKGLISKKYLSAWSTPIRWDVFHWGRILVSHHRARFSRLLPSICYQRGDNRIGAHTPAPKRGQEEADCGLWGIEDELKSVSSDYCMHVHGGLWGVGWSVGYEVEQTGGWFSLHDALAQCPKGSENSKFALDLTGCSAAIFVKAEE